MTDLRGSGVRLVPATVELLDLEEISAAALAGALDVSVPASWPPLHNEPEVRAWFRGRLLADARNAGWLSYYIVASVDGVTALAGTAGYKGPPDAKGEVEIGYSVVANYQRRGIASAAVQWLCERTFRLRVRVVLAETLPELVASQGVLRKAGFGWSGTRVDEEEGEVWCYRLER